MEIILKDENGIICVAIKGRLDAESADEADRAIRDILAEGNCSLLFDLSALEYLSSSGLRVILNTNRELEQKKGKMILCALNIFVKEIFEEHDFPIADSVYTGIFKKRINNRSTHCTITSRDSRQPLPKSTINLQPHRIKRIGPSQALIPKN